MSRKRLSLISLITLLVFTTAVAQQNKKRNGVVEYVLFENEGHGFTKKANEIRAYKAILDFLDRYLKSGDAVSSR